MGWSKLTLKHRPKKRSSNLDLTLFVPDVNANESSNSLSGS